MRIISAARARAQMIHAHVFLVATFALNTHTPYPAPGTLHVGVATLSLVHSEDGSACSAIASPLLVALQREPAARLASGQGRAPVRLSQCSGR